MRTTSTALLAGALVAALGAAGAEASSRTPVFRAQINLVNVAVTITDATSRFVTDLGETDFEVFEDGRPQDLTLFTHERLPVSLAILLDTSQSMSLKLPEAQAAATQFVRTLTAADEAQVIQFNERTRIIQDFTADRSALEGAIKRTRAQGSTGLYNAVYIALKDLSSRRRAEELRRMAVVVLSDGEDTTSLVSDDQVLSLARTSGIAVYGISLRPALPSAARLANEVGVPRYFFSALARDTGGQAHFLREIAQLTGTYDRVAEELRSQYNLGYFSNNDARDGRWRRIQVRLRARPQFQVRHRTGYFAPGR
ncbi:MAG TPA: VWA domain-containing protein [Vicinamibacteria bacterium]|nr:VWA domain-containing protein [Vicinamibacteria bacterium]